MRIGVLASHEGTTLQGIIDARAAGALRAQVVTVIGNNRDSGALRRATQAGILSHHLSSQTHADPDALDTAICAALVEARVDIVVLAGYMKKLGPRALAHFSGRVLNTHPALLPKFGGQGMYGLHVHRAVLAAGEVTTGATVHLVDGEYDAGPIIAQREVPVTAGETPEALAQRVQESERALLVQVLADIAEDRISLAPPSVSSERRTAVTDQSRAELCGAATVLVVNDVLRSVEYYRDVLGFQTEFTYGEPVFYAGVERDGVVIHLQAASHTKRQPGHGGVNIFVSDVDVLYREFTSRGAHTLNEPKDYAYGMRDFDLHDLDGNQLSFGMESKQQPGTS